MKRTEKINCNLASFHVSGNINIYFNIIHLLRNKHTISQRRNEIWRNPRRPRLNLTFISYAYNGSDFEEIISLSFR